MSQNKKLLTKNEILEQLNIKITDLEYDRDELINELQLDNNDNNDNDYINDEIYEINEELHLYYTIIEQLTQTN